MHLLAFYERLPDEEKILVDILRQLVKDVLPDITEKLSYGVPYFFGNRRICMIWPASIPKGGVKKGVLFGFSYGNRLKDENGYLDKGRNKQVYYRIYLSADEIDFEALAALLREAAIVDAAFGLCKLKQ